MTTSEPVNYNTFEPTERYPSWTHKGEKIQDLFVVRPGWEPAAGRIINDFSSRVARCQGERADGTQCTFEGQVPGLHGALFCSRHGPKRVVNPHHLQYATSDNRAHGRIHIADMETAADDPGWHHSGWPLCGGIKPGRRGDPPGMRLLYSQDEANRLNVALASGDEEEKLLRRLCGRCLDAARDAEWIGRVSVEERAETDARWMHEAYGYIDPADISTRDVLRAADRIADQDPDLSAALRRVTRIYTQQVLELKATMGN